MAWPRAGDAWRSVVDVIPYSDAGLTRCAGTRDIAHHPLLSAIPAAVIAGLRAENEPLEKATNKSVGISFKVSEKGRVSVYGMGRFPVTLYVEQWETLLGRTDDLRAFIEANSGRLEKKE